MQVSQVLPHPLTKDARVRAIADAYRFLEDEGPGPEAYVDQILATVRPQAFFFHSIAADELSFPFVLTLGLEFGTLRNRRAKRSPSHPPDDDALSFFLSELSLALLDQSEALLDRRCILSAEQDRRTSTRLTTRYHGAHHDYPMHAIRQHLQRFEPTLESSGITLSDSFAMHPGETVCGIKWFSRPDEASSRCANCDIQPTCAVSREVRHRNQPDPLAQTCQQDRR